MNNIARSGVFLHSPGQMNIRPLLLRSSTKNSRAPVIATRFVTSGPEVKSVEEQKLEWEYSQIMDETPQKGIVNQLREWATPTVFGAAVIVAFKGFAIFQKVGVSWVIFDSKKCQSPPRHLAKISILMLYAEWLAGARSICWIANNCSICSKICRRWPLQAGSGPINDGKTAFRFEIGHERVRRSSEN